MGSLNTDGNKEANEETKEYGMDLKGEEGREVEEEEDEVGLGDEGEGVGGEGEEDVIGEG